ncbi:hypothetical protein NHX12_009694 [Muraenolepis orangiensis]|uniref:Uncharacterized protein n=1 Tax=Muraenolepis orangiensis TaxID=630683 RepID=A0A9Q0DHN9_9TELE|nr:hypothetical protein NHX12_009694 [Muraenolepis orangiensis]
MVHATQLCTKCLQGPGHAETLPGIPYQLHALCGADVIRRNVLLALIECILAFHQPYPPMVSQAIRSDCDTDETEEMHTHFDPPEEMATEAAVSARKLCVGGLLRSRSLSASYR